MKKIEIIKFLQELNVGGVGVSSDSQWVRSQCPLAAFTHFKGIDEKPSFGVMIKENSESTYHCFTCGSGSLRDLIHRMTFTTGIKESAVDFYSLHEIFDKEETELRTFPKFKELFSKTNDRIIRGKVPKLIIDSFTPITQILSNYDRTKMHEWILDRRLDYSVLEKYDVRYDPNGNSFIFPIKDLDNETYALHGRSRKGKFFFYVKPNTEDYKWGRLDSWFGMQFYDPTKPVILVESETDLLRLKSLGECNVIASCGPVSDIKGSRIQSNVIYLGFDSDQIGVKYCKTVINYFKNNPEKVLIRLSWNTLGYKDAGDLKSQEDWAEVYKNKRVLSRVEPIKYKDKFAHIEEHI